VSRLAFAVLVALGLALATSGEASAVPGAMCEQKLQFPARESRVAHELLDRP
jgi:hypothetical protein